MLTTIPGRSVLHNGQVIAKEAREAILPYRLQADEHAHTRTHTHTFTKTPAYAPMKNKEPQEKLTCYSDGLLKSR